MTQRARAATEPRARLSRRVQIGYAAADIGGNAVELAIRLYLLIFYTDAVGLAPTLAGLALGIGLLWDAVTDPVMGALSDRMAARWGRRGFVLAGGLLSAVGFVLLFQPPQLDGDWAKFGWLVFSFCFLNAGLTVVNVPHVSMATEMTELPHERSVLFGWRFACMNFGAILAAAVPELLLHGESDRTVAVMGPFAGIVAAVVVASVLSTFLATRRVAFRFAPPSGRPFLQELREAFANRAFRPLLLASVLATVGIGANSAAALFYYRYRLQLPDAQAHKLIAVALVVFTVSILAWVALGRRYGKTRPPAIGALALGLGTSVVYPLLPAGSVLWPMLVSSVGLGSLLGCIVLIDSLVTDVIDLDTVHSHARRPGLYFGVWRFAAKLARGAAIGGTGWLLEWSGFVSNQEQTPAVQAAIGFLFGPVVGVWFVAAALVLLCSRFSDAKQAQVQRILASRAARSTF